MKTIAIVLMLFIGLAASLNAQTYNLDWLCISSGGSVQQSSTNYQAKLTCAQPVAGHSQSSNYQAFLGFWYPSLGNGTAAEEIITEILPKSFSLEQNYPNPFNPTTTIEFTVPRMSHVKISVYNMLGQLVNVLVDEELALGKYRTVWYGDDMWGNQTASGVYLYRIEAQDFVQTKKMIMLK